MSHQPRDIFHDAILTAPPRVVERKQCQIMELTQDELRDGMKAMAEAENQFPRLPESKERTEKSDIKFRRRFGKSAERAVLAALRKLGYATTSKIMDEASVGDKTCRSVLLDLANRGLVCRERITLASVGGWGWEYRINGLPERGNGQRLKNSRPATAKNTQAASTGKNVGVSGYREVQT